MNIRDISDVGARLGKIVGPKSEHGSAQDYYDHLEEVCIAILDSEHQDFPEHELERHLLTFLERKRQELGLQSE